MATTKGPNPKLFSEVRPVAKFGPKARSLESRFWSKVKKTKQCWVWTGCKNGKAGYGMIYDGDTGRKELAHRAAWKLATGAYPETPVLHRCDNTRCVKFEHLFLGTQSDNMNDKTDKGRGCNQFNSATFEQAEEIVRRYRAGESQQALADEFMFHQTYVSRIVTGRIRHLRASSDGTRQG